MGTLKELLFSIQEGRISTVDGQRHLHTLCTEMKLNPAWRGPLGMLMVVQGGQEELERYENFMMSTNWIFAKVAALHTSIEDALYEVESGVKRLASFVNRQELSFSEEDDGCPCCRKIV